MASDFSRAGLDELKPHCKSCAEEDTITPQTDTSPWSCSYDELRQGAANGCPRCSFVAACIATIERQLESDQISSVKVDPWSNTFSVKISRGEIHLDVITENRETGEFSNI